jgi:hypothetical protein
VVVCLSTRSVGKEGYIQKELRFVLDIALEKPEGSIFVIPLRLENCEIPRRLRSWQYADYFPENRRGAYDRLIISLMARKSAIAKVNNELSTGLSAGKATVVLDEYSIFMLDEENEKLNQLKAIASQKFVYGGTKEKAALRMELLGTISPWIRNTVLALLIPVPVLLTFFVYLLGANISVPYYCFLLIVFVAFYLLGVGLMYRKLIDPELTRRIEKQEERLKQLRG